MSTCMIHSEYFNKDIFFKSSSTINMKTHPANYDNLATGIMPPDYNCTNCVCYGFPCTNCSIYVYDGNIIPPESTQCEIDDKKQWIICFGDFDGVVLPKFAKINKNLKKNKNESYNDIIQGRNWADVSDEEEDL